MDEEENDVEEIVTEFLLNTCRLRPQISQPAMQAAVQSASTATILKFSVTETIRAPDFGLPKE